MQEKSTARLKAVIKKYNVVIFFIILAIAAYIVSGVAPTVFLQEIASRFCRNTFQVLALIIPVIAGLGLNFSIVIGAMAGQMAVIHTVSFGITGFPSFLVSVLISTPLAILFGFLVGKVLNKTKGNEMITSMILGYLANGIYQFIYLYLIGTAIPFPDQSMMNDNGVGIKSSLGFDGTFRYSLTDVWNTTLYDFVLIAGIAALVCVAIYLIRAFIKKKKSGIPVRIAQYIGCAVIAVLAVFLIILRQASFQAQFVMKFVKFPLSAVICILLLCLFNTWIFKTKLGHNFRAVGMNQQVAMVSGINVNRTRIIAMILSTVFAAWGQIIRLQDIGTMNTYSAHEQIALLAVAAILVGGASVVKASNKNALLGIILFHAIFAVSPQVGTALFADSQVGEYFRVFLAYGIIFVALAMNAVQQAKQSKERKR